MVKTSTHQLTMQFNTNDTTSYCACTYPGGCACRMIGRTGYMMFVESALSLANQEVDDRIRNQEEVGEGEAIKVVARRWASMGSNDKAMWQQLAALG